MFRNPFILLMLLAAMPAGAAVESWTTWFVPELQRVESDHQAAQIELVRLGVPMAGLTASEIGYQREHVNAPPLTADRLQVDLGQERVIDSVALVPVVMDWQSADHPAYGFPLRFEVSISDDPRFEEFTLIKSFTDRDFPNPGIAPVTVLVGGQKARYVRISITKLAQENGLYFCAMGELMVLSGNLDVAIGCPVKATRSVEIPPRFSQNYLVDGRTHLGPPIRRDYLEWDGLHAGNISNAAPPWMELDLGKSYPLEQVRIYSTHARRGADVAGFRFPKNFRIEASDNSEFSNAVVLLEAQDYSNPGDNAVVIPCHDVQARYVKMTALFKDAEGGPRFSLSEIQVYSGNQNVARGAMVLRTPDNFPTSRLWPVSLLVDGYTSYGRLMELPEWLQSWTLRRNLERKIKGLEAREVVLAAQARRRAAAFGAGIVLLCMVLVIGFGFVTRFRSQRELQNIRGRLARDIHDHIGSNLAGIAVLSEVAREHHSLDSTQREDWREVHQVARETLDVMREVIWLIGDKKGAELDLMTQMQLAASRMLAGRQFVWQSTTAEFPATLSLEARRDIFLFFKEALTNIVRHSEATHIELSARSSANEFQLGVADNGRGFDPKTVRAGIGLNSQRLRAQALGGTVKITSAPGEGASVQLNVPLGKMRRHLRFFNRWHLS